VAFGTTLLLDWGDCLVLPMERTFRKLDRLVGQGDLGEFLTLNHVVDLEPYGWS